MTTKKIVLLKAGTSFPDVVTQLGDFDTWILAGLGLSAEQVEVREIWRDAPLPEPKNCAGVIMSGAHAMLTDQQPWIQRALDWLTGLLATNTPYLGICFGHQMLAQAMGGQVDFHPGGREIGCVELNLHAASAIDPLFDHLPTQFSALAIHAQSVRILPPDAVLLAGNEFEPHHAFRIGKNAWGIQFHPEFNSERMTAYVHHLAPQLKAAGQDQAQIRAGLCDTHIAASLLPKFRALTNKQH
jgi:GMP synthase (glutamine-hydrolysing)